ncbi:MAG: heavy-metal-associated domain-containing protein [Bacteroidota bacterium]
MKHLVTAIVFTTIAALGHAQIKSASLQASGLTCALCAKSIYTKLTALPFVDKVDTDLNASTFEISFKEGRHVDPEALRKKVEDAGFSVSQLHLHYQANNQMIGHDTHIKVGENFYHVVNTKPKTYSGVVTLHVIDKEFLTLKDHKKIVGGSNLDCYKPGSNLKCVVPNHEVHELNLFHVTIK